MPTAHIIAGLFILLAVLMCYAFFSQTLTQKKEQKSRLTVALKTRARNYKLIIGGVPENFISKELSLLVHRSLIEVLEQLTKLEPADTRHEEELQQVNSNLIEVQNKARPTTETRLQSHQQIKETKTCLEELHKFIFLMESRKSLSKNLAEGFRLQIKQLVLQITVDGYTLNGQAAHKQGKLKLALHHYDLALGLVLRDGRGKHMKSRITELKSILERINAQLAESEENQATEAEATDEVVTDDEWAEAEEDPWKKKNVYD